MSDVSVVFIIDGSHLNPLIAPNKEWEEIEIHNWNPTFLPGRGDYIKLDDFINPLVSTHQLSKELLKAIASKTWRVSHTVWTFYRVEIHVNSTK